MSWALLAVCAGTLTHASEPRTPHDDGEVLETLPRALFASRDEVAELRRRLAAAPTDPEIARSAATRFVQLGSQTGDARFYGYAQSALAPWWEVGDPPTELLRLRAKLKEKNHNYDLALADLQMVLQRYPTDAQAWIEASNIFRVQGKYDKARQACEKLSAFADPFAVALCRIPILAVTGGAEEAHRLLAEILPEAKQNYPSVEPWILTMQTEIALALGRDDEAEERLRDGLAKAPADRYLLRAYGELLLEKARYDEAFALVEGQAEDDGLLLCAAIAARRSGRTAEAEKLQARLESRFAEVRQRGDQPLGRFEARSMLFLKDDPAKALELALKNWSVQKETHDTQTVLEAAIAAHAPDQARPVVAFLAASGATHVVLDTLVAQLESMR
jgi:tetratricopeptide (TPR) repeat protein